MARRLATEEGIFCGISSGMRAPPRPCTSVIILPCTLNSRVMKAASAHLC